MTLDQGTLRKYLPYILMNDNEPFKPLALGTTIFTETMQSKSFRRVVEVDQTKVKYVIEYAMYWNYDSQHMYDLEHMWVYVGHSGEVVDCEGSFHGKFLKGLKKDKSNIMGTHAVLYCQPGKHALVAYQEILHAIPDLVPAAASTFKDTGLCRTYIIEDKIEVTEAINALANEALAAYKFVPSETYHIDTLEGVPLMTWEELHDAIPCYLEEELKVLREKRG